MPFIGEVVEALPMVRKQDPDGGPVLGVMVRGIPNGLPGSRVGVTRCVTFQERVPMKEGGQAPLCRIRM